VTAPGRAAATPGVDDCCHTDGIESRFRTAFGKTTL
jgi:hypothetical protein